MKKNTASLILAALSLLLMGAAAALCMFPVGDMTGSFVEACVSGFIATFAAIVVLNVR